jgi:hypothetical protein
MNIGADAGIALSVAGTDIMPLRDVSIERRVGHGASDRGVDQGV